MGEGNVFSLFTSGGGGGSVQPEGGGVSPAGGGGQSSRQGGGSVQPAGGGGGSVQPAGGVSPASGGGGVRQGGGVSQDRTYYTVGGMPLAFTQEDFLVSRYIHKCYCLHNNVHHAIFGMAQDNKFSQVTRLCKLTDLRCLKLVLRRSNVNFQKFKSVIQFRIATYRVATFESIQNSLTFP